MIKDSGKRGLSAEPQDMHERWDAEARLMLDRDQAPTINAARETIVIDALQRGDTGPFADWVRRGWIPSQMVLVMLAEMMQGRSETAEVLPFTIECRKRPGQGAGRRKKAAPRDDMIADFVQARRAEGMPYKAAIAAVMDIDGMNFSEKTVRDAFDQKYGRKAQQLG